jgi:VanZ family protein
MIVDPRTRPFLPRPHWLDGVVAVLVLGILYASLARRGEMDCTGFAKALLNEAPLVSGADALGNTFAYLLLGAALAFAWAHRRPRLAAAGTPWQVSLAMIAACALLSFSMEAVQACMTERMSSRWDLLTNTLGAALGWYGARILQPLWAAFAGHAAGGGRGRLLAVVSMGALAWLVSQTAPWVPAFSTAMLGMHVAEVRQALATGSLDPWVLAARGGEWLALGAAFAMALRRRRLAVLPMAALAAAAVIGRLLLPNGPLPSGEALVTLPVALLGALVLPRLGPRACAAVLLTGVLVAVGASELAPGNGPPEPFNWRAMLLRGNAVAGIESAAWFAWVAMSIAVAGHGLGGRTRWWAVVPAVLLGVLAWLQTGIPGRSPELSPILVALACSGLAAGMLGGSHGARIPVRRRR